MSFLTRLFKRREPEDFEQVLSALAADIQQRQTRLADLRLRERRVTLVFTLYTLGAWFAYVSVWYANPGLLPRVTHGTRSSALERALRGAPVVVGPVLILFLVRVVQWGYRRIGNTEEKHLQTLRKTQREKIEEFKKKTDYYKTRTLLERFDDAPSAAATGVAVGSPPRNRSAGAPTPMATPQRPAQGLPALAALQTPARPGVPNHLSPTPQQPTGPPRKQWYDKVADALLGDDDAVGAGTASRYALICQKCFAHNGLVKESMWEDAQYVCPKCGHFNPSMRSQRSRNGSPMSPMSALPSAVPPAGLLHQSHALAPPLGVPVGVAPPVEKPATVQQEEGGGDAGEKSMSMEVDS